jgi:Calcineurin-like phosphoesterase
VKDIKELVAALKLTGAALGKDPSKVTMKELEANGVSERQTRKFGSLPAIKKKFFPESDKSLADVKETNLHNSYISKLENAVGSKELFERQILSLLEKNIKTIKCAPLKSSSFKKYSTKDSVDREVVVSLNDTHYGAIVKSEEVNGSNVFNWEVACRRTAFLAQQVVEYKAHRRSEVKRLHVILNGDMLQGVIHDLTARTAELLVNQQVGAMLINFIAYVSSAFPEIVVHAISGNHDDSPHRREGHRVTSHKYDSNVTPVYAALSAAFRGNANIKFNFPKGLHLDVNLLGGRMLVTHGDTLFSKQLGNPSTNLNVKGLSDAINRFNTGEITKGKALIKLVLFGHVHNYVNFTTFDGVNVYVAPSLSGIDSYAHSLGINTNQIGQVIFESTKKHIMADARLVDLSEADNDKSLDAIIPVYKNQLVVK